MTLSPDALSSLSKKRGEVYPVTLSLVGELASDGRESVD